MRAFESVLVNEMPKYCSRYHIASYGAKLNLYLIPQYNLYVKKVACHCSLFYTRDNGLSEVETDILKQTVA
jgi:hypothetical protein